MTDKTSNTKPVIMVGAGGHARVLLDCLALMQRHVIAVASPDFKMAAEFGIVLRNDDDILKYAVREVELVNAIGSIDIPKKRQERFEYFKNKGYTFASVIHPSAVIAQSAVLDEGVQIMAGCVIQPGCQIGSNTLINTKASIDHDAVIGSHCHIAPGVTVSGNVSINAGTHVGVGAIVIQGVAIGVGCFIAAGSCVTKDVQDHQRVKGLPASVWQ